MDNLNLIFLGIGFVTLFICLVLLIVKLLKGNGKIPLGLISSMMTGFLLILIGFGLMVPNLKEKIISVVSKEEEVPTLAGEGASRGDLAGINETEPQKIARKLVKQEMSKQVELKKWEITENIVTSDKNVHNISDYEKPVGDMRIVWISGNVKATSDNDNTGNVGYELELYQIKYDNKWYIGNHWGVLIDLEVTEKPVVNEDERYLSDNEEMIIDEETGGLSSYNVPDYGESFEEANPTTEKDLIGAWHWSESDDYYMILRKDSTYSYIEPSMEFVSEGTYTVNQSGDYYEVKVNYTTGQNDSVMTIKLINKNHLEGNENGYSWKAERVHSAEAEDILNLTQVK